MLTETISIPLDPQTARAYGAARAEEKLKMQALVGLWLRELTSNELPSLEQVRTKQGARHRRAGLLLRFWTRF
jgi:hypothetical protein